MIIVLTTGGKNEDMYRASISIHDSKGKADDFCLKNTDDPKCEKYWTYSEIIEPGIEYEVCRYKNYKQV